MFFHLKPILLSLVVLAGYELMIYRFEWRFWILGILLVVIIAGTRLATNAWHNSLLPILFFAGSAILSFFISGGVFLQVYIAISGLIYYLIILGVYRINANAQDETAQKINFITSFTVIFIWAASLFAIYLNRNIDFWIISSALYAIVVVATHQLLKTADIKGRKANRYWLYSFTIAYCLAIMSWGVIFLPFGYLTLSVLLLVVYFTLVNYLTRSIKGTFSKMAFAIDLFIFLISAGAVLVSTRWGIIE
ncbi:MAG: hypothetical protein U9Q72_03715 [Patescibacteria group bacterium]|nr:hypothetical protein [Patescibacteria group bacterium]